jgi:hypothetical protein
VVAEKSTDETLDDYQHAASTAREDKSASGTIRKHGMNRQSWFPIMYFPKGYTTRCASLCSNIFSSGLGIEETTPLESRRATQEKGLLLVLEY